MVRAPEVRRHQRWFPDTGPNVPPPTDLGSGIAGARLVHDGGVKRLGPALLVATVVACAANGVVPELDADAERGRQVSLDEGCAVCHGQYGQGGAAGSFFGVWGSEVELDDGSLVTADADYLRRAIVDPAADIAAGSDLEMPAVPLTDEQVAELLTWIEALAEQP